MVQRIHKGFFGIWLRGWGWAGEVPEFLTMVLAGFFGVLWVYYEFRHTPLGWNSRSRSSRSLQLVEAGPRALTPDRFPLLGGCQPRGSPRLWGVPSFDLMAPLSQ
jgi:hypothetical protein